MVDQRRVGFDVADAEDQAALDRMAVVGHDAVGGDVRAVGQVVLQVDGDHLAVRGVSPTSTRSPSAENTAAHEIGRPGS